MGLSRRFPNCSRTAQRVSWAWKVYLGSHTLRLGTKGLLLVLNLRVFQCSYISFTKDLVESDKSSSIAGCRSDSNKTGGLSTDANGCFVWAVLSRASMTSSNWSSEHCVDAFRFLFMDLRWALSSSSRSYGQPQQSSTVEEKRIYVAG